MEECLVRPELGPQNVKLIRCIRARQTVRARAAAARLPALARRRGPPCRPCKGLGVQVSDNFDVWMQRLPGGITKDEASLLRRLAAEAGAGCIVEVGSYRGKSAVALAYGVRDARRDPPTPI